MLLVAVTVVVVGTVSMVCIFFGGVLLDEDAAGGGVDSGAGHLHHAGQLLGIGGGLLSFVAGNVVFKTSWFVFWNWLSFIIIIFRPGVFLLSL